MSLHPSEFGRRITACWSPESATTYSIVNPARGQCSVTALVAQDHLGGEIMKTRVAEAWHFYNVIDGRRWDFTEAQFDLPIIYEDRKSNREEAMTDTTLRQYEALSTHFSNGD